MPTPVVVITTAASDTYHSDEDCTNFQAGQDIARTVDGDAPDVIMMSLGQALAHRHPCPRCLR